MVKVDVPDSLRTGKPFNYKKLFSQPSKFNLALLVGGIVMSSHNIASADPCDQATVAAQEGFGWFTGAGIAAVLSRIPFGGPIGIAIGVGSLIANAPKHQGPPPAIYGAGTPSPERGREYDYRRNLH